jgi:hypothetical protein
MLQTRLSSHAQLKLKPTSWTPAVQKLSEAYSCLLSSGAPTPASRRKVKNCPPTHGHSTGSVEAQYPSQPMSIILIHLIDYGLIFAIPALHNTAI